MGMDVPPRAVWLRTLLAELNRVLSAPDVPRRLAARLPRRPPSAKAAAARHGGGHRRPAALHGQPDRRPAPGRPGRLDRAGPHRRRRRSATGCPGSGAARRDPRAGRRGRRAGRRRRPVVRRLRPGRPRQRGGRRPAPRRPLPRVRRPGRAGGPRRPRATSRPGSAACSAQVGVALDLVDACLDALPAGPVDVRLPKSVRPPEGSTYCWTENPLGAMGYYLVSRGGDDAVAARHADRVVQQRQRAARCCCPGCGCPTCRSCSRRCSSCWATSTSRVRACAGSRGTGRAPAARRRRSPCRTSRGPGRPARPGCR